jgi:hypothetical protein
MAAVRYSKLSLRHKQVKMRLYRRDELKIKTNNKTQSGNSQDTFLVVKALYLKLSEGRQSFSIHAIQCESIVGFIKTTAAEIISKFPTYVRQINKH